MERSTPMPAGTRPRAILAAAMGSWEQVEQWADNGGRHGVARSDIHARRQRVAPGALSVKVVSAGAPHGSGLRSPGTRPIR